MKWTPIDQGQGDTDRLCAWKFNKGIIAKSGLARKLIVHIVKNIKILSLPIF